VFAEKLEALKSLRMVREVRLLGLMIGIELRVRAKPIVDSLAENGVLALTAGPTTVRFLPSLNIPLNLVEEACGIFVETVRSYESRLGGSASN